VGDNPPRRFSLCHEWPWYYHTALGQRNRSYGVLACSRGNVGRRDTVYAHAEVETTTRFVSCHLLLLLLLQVLVSAAMRYRVLLSHHVLAVAPLLELSPAASPSAADLASYTLQLEATCSKVGGEQIVCTWRVLLRSFRGCWVGRVGLGQLHAGLPMYS
jgi:hypothetical protein